MASDLKLRSEIPHDSNRFLPQVGFGQDVTFDTIVTYNRFLFRVYTPKSAVSSDQDSAFFVGSKFNKTYAPSTPILSDIHLPFGLCISETATYDDCINHLSWETRSTSPFISTSFSFAWAIWDAVRRYNSGVKHDVEIAVIDAAALSGKAVTALQLLRKAHGQHHQKHGRWQRFAQESQSVLVYGFIPRSAVLASVPLLSVLDRLPSYFTKPSTSEVPLHILSWDFDNKQSTYRKFCQEMADQFQRLPFQTRVRDTAVGSVRLAITLLNPWFYNMVQEDLLKAVSKTRDLASIIAHWPEPSGSRETNEMGALIRALIYLLAEEVRANHACKREAEVVRLQGVIDHLEEVVHDQEKLLSARLNAHEPSFSSQDQEEPRIWDRQEDPLLPETLVHLPVSPARQSLKITIPPHSTESSSSSDSSPSPITPSSFSTPPSLPTTPSKIRFTSPVLTHPPSPEFSSSSMRSLSPPQSPLLLPPTVFPCPSTPEILSRPPSPSLHNGPMSSPVSSSSSAITGREKLALSIPLPIPWTSSLASAISPSAYLSALPSLPQESSELDSHMADGCKDILDDLKTFLPPRKPVLLEHGPVGGRSESETGIETQLKGKGKVMVRLPSPDRDGQGDEAVKNDDDEFEILRLKDLEFDEPPEEYHSPSRNRSSVPETMSCVISGFLIGAFITLCILSSQRRTLITNLT